MIYTVIHYIVDCIWGTCKLSVYSIKYLNNAVNELCPYDKSGVHELCSNVKSGIHESCPNCFMKFFTS